MARKAPSTHALMYDRLCASVAAATDCDDEDCTTKVAFPGCLVIEVDVLCWTLVPSGINFGDVDGCHVAMQGMLQASGNKLGA